MTTSTEPVASRQGAPRKVARRRVRGTPLTWVRRGGLANLLFLLPLLGIFGVFSWGPIVESFIISFQHTNFIVTTWADPLWSNFVFVFKDPNFCLAVRNTG